MKRYLLFLAPMLALMSVFFISAFRLGQHHPKPQTYTIQHNTFWVNPDDTWGPAPGPSTIGSACTMKKDAKLNWDWWTDKEGNVCGYLNEDSIMLTAYARQTDSLAMFSSKADAVQWVESQPYRQGGAK